MRLIKLVQLLILAVAISTANPGLSQDTKQKEALQPYQTPEQLEPSELVIYGHDQRRAVQTRKLSGRLDTKAIVILPGSDANINDPSALEQIYEKLVRKIPNYVEQQFVSDGRNPLRIAILSEELPTAEFAVLAEQVEEALPGFRVAYVFSVDDNDHPYKQYLFVTDTFSAKFNLGKADVDAIKALNKKHGLSAHEHDDKTKQALVSHGENIKSHFILRLTPDAEKNPLEIMREYNQSDMVTYAYPNILPFRAVADVQPIPTYNEFYYNINGRRVTGQTNYQRVNIISGFEPIHPRKLEQMEFSEREGIINERESIGKKLIEFIKMLPHANLNSFTPDSKLLYWTLALNEPLTDQELIELNRQISQINEDAKLGVLFDLEMKEVSVTRNGAAFTSNPWLTDEFMVSFRHDASQEQINKLNQENHVEVVDVIPAEPGQPQRYLLRVTAETGVNALETANYYHDSQRELVEYAHPYFHWYNAPFNVNNPHL